jgi:uncharacterized protein (TIGR02246 family)
MVQAVRSRIEETNTQFTKAVSKGDTATVASLYTEDAIVLPPNMTGARGRGEIKRLFDGMFQQMGPPNLKLTTSQVTELGDTAYEVGTYTMKAQPQGGQAVSDTGKYVVIWQRQRDGDWKLHVDIWNSDTPLPTP